MAIINRRRWKINATSATLYTFRFAPRQPQILRCLFKCNNGKRNSFLCRECMIPTKPAEDGWMFVNLAEAKHLKGLKPKKNWVRWKKNLVLIKKDIGVSWRWRSWKWPDQQDVNGIIGWKWASPITLTCVGSDNKND